MCTAETEAILQDDNSFYRWTGQANATDIASVSACIDRKIAAIKGSSSATSTAMEEILALQEQVKKKEEEILIAKDRARLAKDGARMPSYYESWFPLGRPMKPILVPVFLGLSLFFLLIALFYFASLYGYTVTVLFPVPRDSFGSARGFFSRFFSIFPASFWVLLVIAAAVIYYHFKVMGSTKCTMAARRE
jgi:hypothetical protein